MNLTSRCINSRWFLKIVRSLCFLSFPEALVSLSLFAIPSKPQYQYEKYTEDARGLRTRKEARQSFALLRKPRVPDLRYFPV